MTTIGQHSIVVDNLSRHFGRFRAVDGVSFDVRSGEIFGFLGANGAGKSTTIRMLCGLLAPSGGRARVAGHDISREAELVRRKIGYMSQKFSLYGDLTVSENIAFFGGVYGIAEKSLKGRSEQVLGLLDLGEVRKTFAGELPRGFQQRLSFACAILHSPQVIFLDEPTAGVDPLQRRRFWDLINNLSASGVTVFVTTHFLDEAEFCNRISLIAAGRIIATDTPSGLKSMLSDLDVYEIECDQAVAALEVLQGLDWVRQAAIFGSAVHASVRHAEGVSERICAALASRGIGISRIERIAPSLEDVFLHLVEDGG